jgi:hypothetical protein
MTKRTQREHLQRLPIVSAAAPEETEVIIELDGEIGRRIDALTERIRGGDVPTEFIRHLTSRPVGAAR